MNPITKNILAVVIGWIGGSLVNMALVQIGHSIFPVEGLDPNDMEAMADIMPTLGSQHFIFPFLAHALGTLVGAAIAYKVAASHHFKLAMGIGVLFLMGGIAVNIMIPGPAWFAVLDIVVAYIPMAWLGTNLISKKS